MADLYSRKILKVVVAQISQAIGWHSIQSTPLELMTDVLSRYLEEMGKLMHRYAEQFGHTEPDLDDVGLAFRDMGIYMHELEEYIRNVDCVACSFEIPKFPIPKDSHLNFLKPGSREVVTRPVHVHEHLPPMHPEMEEEDYTSKQTPLSVDVTPASGSSSPLSSPKATIFKRPGDPVSVENSALKRARLTVEEEGRPLREISSVMMTTSGFLSPAREGKLPESRTPLQPSDSRSNSPQPSSYPMVPPEVKGEKKYKKGPVKRTVDGVKKLDKENKKKEHKTKGTVQSDQGNPSDDSRVKKLVSMKELSKLKALKPGALKMMSQSSTPGPSTNAKPKATKSSAKSLQSNNQKGVRAKATTAAAAVINATAASMEVSATALPTSSTTVSTIAAAAAATTTISSTNAAAVATTAAINNTTTTTTKAITTTTADALNNTITSNTTNTTAVPCTTISDSTITTTTITTTHDTAATSITTVSTTAPLSPLSLTSSSTTIPANAIYTATTVSAAPASSSAATTDTTTALAASSSTSNTSTSNSTIATDATTTGMSTTTGSSGNVAAATDTIAPVSITTVVTTSSASATIIAAASSTTSVVVASSTALPPAVEKLKESNVIEGKLLAEPDKQKLNIFKKISKVKETEKVDRSEFADAPPLDSRESSPGLVIDESDANNRQREARMAQIEECIDSVIQRSMEISETPSKPKTPSGTHIVEDSSKIQYHPADSSSQNVDSSNDVYMFDDDLFPPGTPSTPKTPELPISVNKSEKVCEPKEKKKKKDKSKSKLKSKAKGAVSPKKLKVDVADGSSADWPKAPEGLESSESASAPVFPFFPHFQPAPGLIPPPIAHPLFQRFPLPMAKNLPHPAMPNLPMPPPLFMQSRADDSADIKEKSLEKGTDKPPALPSTGVISNVKLEKEKEDEKGPLSSAPSAAVAVTAATTSGTTTAGTTTLLPERKLGEKKPKEHKKEKKEKERAKKKKERKEKLKNKEKEEKKKPKGEKKEKDKEKIKDKKEKKEKKKDKEREEKVEGIVPKLTFKLAPVSPRPPTPDATLRKIVIKPVLKKQLTGPDDDNEKIVILPSAEIPLKRDPSPELARISALITRPPRQKASSKTSFLKQESPADGFPTSSQPSLPPCASVVCAPIASTAPISSPSSPLSTAGSAPSPAASIGAGGGLSATKVKKAFKPISKLKARDVAKKSGADSEPHKEPIAFYYDNEGKKVWFCPACGGQDDGSPMIGCDDCDAWYHWVCVGIQVPPDENEDWYCCVCIKKKQEHIVDKKKKSRKRKMVT